MLLSTEPVIAKRDSIYSERYLVISKKIIDCLEKWDLAQNRGIAVCQLIENVKSKALENKEKGESLYPEELTGHCNKLKILVSVFEDIVNIFKESKKQFEALEKLVNKEKEIIFRTWDTERFSSYAETLVEHCAGEYWMKVKVLENIAHSESKEDLVMHTSIWEYPVFAFNLKELLRCLVEECL